MTARGLAAVGAAVPATSPRRQSLRRLLLLAAFAATAAAVLALTSATGGGTHAAADPHALVGRVPRHDLNRILQAAGAVTSDTPQAALAAEGRRLFGTTTGVKPGESCRGCHVDGGGTDADVGTITHPVEAGDFRGARNPPSLWRVGSTAPYGWGGREPSLEAFVVGTIRMHFVDGERQPDATTARQAAAIVAYLQTLEPPVSDFDRGTLSPAARRGEQVFQGKGACSACHGGPLLTDNALHDTLVPRIEATDTDPGAASSGRLKGAFNTPQLRDLRATAPYMHNGSMKTLGDVVDFYDRRSIIAPLRLTPAEKADLVAYLESL